MAVMNKNGRMLFSFNHGNRLNGAERFENSYVQCREQKGHEKNHEDKSSVAVNVNG
jgi:hypothetical protein